MSKIATQAEIAIRRDAILDLLRPLGEEGLTIDGVADALGRDDRDNVRHDVAAMVDEHYLYRHGAPHTRRQVFTVTHKGETHSYRYGRQEHLVLEYPLIPRSTNGDVPEHDPEHECPELAVARNIVASLRRELGDAKRRVAEYERHLGPMS